MEIIFSMLCRNVDCRYKSVNYAYCHICGAQDGLFTARSDMHMLINFEYSLGCDFSLAVLILVMLNKKVWAFKIHSACV